MTPGIVTYQLLFGNYPFFGMTLNELFECIKSKSGERLELPADVQLSPEMQALLSGLLQMDPERRISWEQFFNHAVFQARKSPARPRQGRFGAFQSEKGIQSPEGRPEASYACEGLRRGAGKKGDPRQSGLASFSSVSVSGPKAQSRSGRKASRAPGSEKFHSQKNTPPLRHRKYRLGRAEDASRGRESTFSFLTNHRDYAETTLTRQNFFERRRGRPAQGETLSPWLRPRGSAREERRPQLDLLCPSAGRRGESGRATVRPKRSEDRSRELQLESKQEPSRVRGTSERGQIEKSVIPMKEVVARMADRHVAQENEYFFCHEGNKLRFLLRVARDSLRFLGGLTRPAPGPGQKPAALHDPGADEPQAGQARGQAARIGARAALERLRPQRLRALLRKPAVRGADH